MYARRGEYNRVAKVWNIIVYIRNNCIIFICIPRWVMNSDCKIAVIVTTDQHHKKLNEYIMKYITRWTQEMGDYRDPIGKIIIATKEAVSKGTEIGNENKIINFTWQIFMQINFPPQPTRHHPFNLYYESPFRALLHY